MRKFLKILPIVLLVSFIPAQAHASLFDAIGEFVSGLFTQSPMDELSANILNLAQLVNKSTSDMMRFGDMLMCTSLHGSMAVVKISVGPLSLSLGHIISPCVWLSGAILYVVGFILLMMSSYYLFDAAFNLSISIVLLPLGLALWPFGWTRDKLKIIIDSIVYYVGVFIFLPLGILMAKEIAFAAVDEAFLSSGFDFMTAYEEDKGELIEDNLGIFCLPFLKVLLCFIVASRVIPLMAMDFCKYFFGSALVGTPVADRIKDMAKSGAKQAKKAGKFGKDVAKHQAGNKISSIGGRMGGKTGAALAKFGQDMAKTRKGGQQ